MKSFPQKIDIKFEEIGDLNVLRKQWEYLEKVSTVSVFLTWHWIGNWIVIIPTESALYELSVFNNIHNDRNR